MSRKGCTSHRRGFIITSIGLHTLPVALISQESDKVVIDCNKAFIDFKSDITRQVTFPVVYEKLVFQYIEVEKLCKNIKILMGWGSSQKGREEHSDVH